MQVTHTTGITATFNIGLFFLKGIDSAGKLLNPNTTKKASCIAAGRFFYKVLLDYALASTGAIET
jgi:hypothetical protein